MLLYMEKQRHVSEMKDRKCKPLIKKLLSSPIIPGTTCHKTMKNKTKKKKHKHELKTSNNIGLFLSWYVRQCPSEK